VLAEGMNVAPILCHVCQQPAYITPPSQLTHPQFQRHVKKYWEARHVDDSPICQEGSTPC
jgi:hypothetical protein